MNTRAALEAILFVAESPIPERELAEVLESPVSDVKAALAMWAEELASEERGITLRNVASGWEALYEAFRSAISRTVLDHGGSLAAVWRSVGGAGRGRLSTACQSGTDR